MLLLDGTGSLGLNRSVFGPKLREKRIAIERDAEIVQVHSKGFSRQSILGKYSNGSAMAEHRVGDAERLCRQIEKLITDAPGKTKFVAATKQVREVLELFLPSNVKCSHFGALRGVNEFEDCDTAIIVGREQVSPAALEAMTRPFTASDPEPLFSWGEYVLQSRGRRMANGSVAVELVWVHPDPRCQERLEQVREAELVQAIDRVRPIFNRRLIYVLTSVVADITVTRSVRWAELVAGSSAVQQMVQAGAVPNSYADMARAYPNLFKSGEAARKALSRETPDNSPIVLLFEKCPGFQHCRYRRKRTRGPAGTLLYDPKRIHPEQWLRERLGEIELLADKANPETTGKKNDEVRKPTTGTGLSAPEIFGYYP